MLTSGCARFRHEQHEMVYVSIRETYLHDRVAPVSDRVCQVTNGQALQVLEHGRRFLKVKTDNNEIGWIEQHAVIDGKTYDAFVELAEKHKDDPVAATAALRDDLAMHILPGRETERFYLLAGSTKVELLARASVPKHAPEALGPLPGATKASQPESLNAAPEKGAKTAAATGAEAPARQHQATAGEPEAGPPEMEDWWLARDPQGRVGWLLASRLDVDVPDAVGQYGEDQRFVGCWMLTKVYDPEASTPDHEVPEYLTVLAPPKYGLPFDFDQVRVFTWSVNHHRYETGFRLHPIQGYLPVRVYSQSTAKGNVPAFSFQIAGSQDIRTDPETGITRPAVSRTISYEMIETQVKRIGPDLGSIPITHETEEKKAEKAGRKKGK